MSNTIRQAIEQVSGAILAEPARAKAKSSATAHLREGLKCEVMGPRSERVLTDMPKPMGGEASGPNPGWLLRAAMASCTATVIAMRAAKLGIALSSLEVTVESESDQRGLLGLDDAVSAGLRDWRTRVKIGGAASPQALRELVAWAEQHSPVGCSVRQASGCSLDVEVGEA